MKKIVKTVILVAAFTTATIFMSCSDAISEDEQEQNIEATSKLEEIDAGRYGYGGHYGHCGHGGHGSNTTGIGHP